MPTIDFTNGPIRYKAQVELSGSGELSVSVHRHDQEHLMLHLCGDPRRHWQQLVQSDEFVPLGVLRRTLRIFDDHYTKVKRGDLQGLAAD